jgi:hypothetical protein
VGTKIRSAVEMRFGLLSTATFVKAEKQSDQHIRDNRRISTDETVSETSISHGKKRSKNGLKSNQKYFILMEM